MTHYSTATLHADFAAAMAGDCGPADVHGMLAAHPVTLPAFRRLLAGGVDAALLGQMNCAGDLGAARVDLSRDGARFSFGGPDARLLLAVRDADYRLIDVVALASHDENQWSLLTGHADMLGAWHIDALERALACERPARLRLFATPWDWLRAGGAGVCVLNWSAGAVRALRQLGEGAVLEADDAALRSKIKAMLVHGGNPLVSAPRNTLAAASLAERIAMEAVHG